MSHLFTYGLLMQESVWRSVVGEPPFRTPARLYGYRRLCVPGAGYPGICPAEPIDTALRAGSGDGAGAAGAGDPAGSGEGAGAAQPAEVVEGILWYPVDSEILARTDAFEDEGEEYYRITETVYEKEGHAVRAWVYVYAHPELLSDVPWVPSH